jgi:serine/threonine protein kinase
MWKTLQHPNVLALIGVMMSEAHFAMISEWMVNGNINDFVKARPDVNRIALVSLRLKSPCFGSVYNPQNSQLEGVAKGLIHIHSQGMTHGDLRGVRT